MNLLQFFLACVVMVATMHIYHHWLGFDPLAFEVLNGPYVSIDSWSFVHVIWFAGLGWLYPDRLAAFFTYGVIWEVLEAILASTALKDFWQERGINSFWDLWFNLLGYRLGEIALLILVDPPPPKRKARREQNVVAAE